MSFATVNWANKNVPSLVKLLQMQANTDHLLAELEAVNIATYGSLSGLPKYSATVAFGVKVDSLLLGTVPSLTTVATDYSLLNKDISGLAVGQHTLYFNNLVAKWWRPEGADYVSTWIRAKTNATGRVFIDFATVMMHRTPL